MAYHDQRAFALASALSGVAAAAETARAALERVPLGDAPMQEVSTRLAATAAHVDALRVAAAEGTLRDEAVRPVLVPTRWQDIPEFLAVRKDPAMAERDREAEKVGREVEGRSSTAQYHAACDAALEAFHAAVAAAAVGADAAAAPSAGTAMRVDAAAAGGASRR